MYGTYKCMAGWMDGKVQMQIFRENLSIFAKMQKITTSSGIFSILKPSFKLEIWQDNELMCVSSIMFVCACVWVICKGAIFNQAICSFLKCNGGTPTEMAARVQLYSIWIHVNVLSAMVNLFFFLQTLWLPPRLLPVTLAACNIILYLRLRLMSG